MYKSVYYRINKAKTAYKWLNCVLSLKKHLAQNIGGVENEKVLKTFYNNNKT
jgi:hypothetical protein